MASMVSRLATLVTILLAVLAGVVRAQDPLTLDQAVSAALANNAGLRAAAAGVRESAARKDEARAAYLPRLDYIEDWQHGNNPVYVFGSLLSQRRFTAANFDVNALNHPDALTNYHGAFALQQPVYDSQRIAGIKSASPRQPGGAADVRRGAGRHGAGRDQGATAACSRRWPPARRPMRRSRAPRTTWRAPSSGATPGWRPRPTSCR